MMYPWANPNYLLDEMSLDQLILFHRHGWNTRKTEANLFFGVLGQLLSGDEGASKQLEKFKKSHPDAQIKDGAWVVSR